MPDDKTARHPYPLWGILTSSPLFQPLLVNDSPHEKPRKGREEQQMEGKGEIGGGGGGGKLRRHEYGSGDSVASNRGKERNSRISGTRYMR